MGKGGGVEKEGVAEDIEKKLDKHYKLFLKVIVMMHNNNGIKYFMIVVNY